MEACLIIRNDFKDWQKKTWKKLICKQRKLKLNGIKLFEQIISPTLCHTLQKSTKKNIESHPLTIMPPVEGKNVEDTESMKVDNVVQELENVEKIIIKHEKKT